MRSWATDSAWLPAIPSVHAGLTAMVALFLWRRVHRWWRPVLVAYVLVMAFALVYSAEHYVCDILLGWVLALAISVLAETLDPRVPGQAGTGSVKYQAIAESLEPRQPEGVLATSPSTEEGPLLR